MATALTTTSLSSSSDEDEVLQTETTNEQNNRSRVQLFLDLGREAILKRFHDNDTQSFSTDPHELFKELQVLKPQIDQLKKDHVLQQDQYDLLIPPTGDTVDSTQFDITLLMILLTNFCGFKYPLKRNGRQDRSWFPQVTDTDEFSNIVRVKKLRDLFSHKTHVSDDEFDKLALEFQEPLLALGETQAKIDHIHKIRLIDEPTRTTLDKYEKPLFNHNLTLPVENFSHREKELDDLHDKLTNSLGSKLGVVLCGFPGVGKSETARKFCKEHQKTLYKGSVMWINAESRLTLESEFQDIADELGILGIKTSAGNYVETKKLVNSVYRHLTVKIEESTNMILMVFDGADDQSALLEFLPKSADYTPRILVTSQCTKWDSKFNCLELDMFNEENALKFFTDNTMKPQYTDAREIAELLNTISRHPLALQQAVSYIKENSVTVEEYTNLLDERHKDMMSKGTDQIGNPSVNKTLDTSINRLRKISLDVSDILDILAFLDGKEICKGFLIMFLNNDQVRLNSALTLLRKYAIVNYEINSKAEYNHQMIRIHSLAQLFLQSNQNVQEVSKNLEKITSAFIEDLRMCNKLYKPRDGKLWLNHFYKIYENNKWKKCLLNSFIYEQMLLEHFMESKGNYTKLLEIYEYIINHIIDVNHPEYLTTKHNMASCHQKMNNDEKALQLYQEVEEAQLKTLGTSHADYIRTKHNLAICLNDKKMKKKSKFQ